MPVDVVILRHCVLSQHHEHFLLQCYTINVPFISFLLDFRSLFILLIFFYFVFVLRTAYIFSDRLEIRPSKMWQHFLSRGELLPKALDRKVHLHLRKRQGPGRYTGRKVLNIGKLRLVITLYELDSDTNSHELRVVLYETRHSQTAEYRLSSMERLMLFQDNVPILEQICGRLRHVYCDVTDKSRTLIVLEKGDVPALDAPFEVDGDDEYDIRSQASDAGVIIILYM